MKQVYMSEKEGVDNEEHLEEKMSDDKKCPLSMCNDTGMLEPCIKDKCAWWSPAKSSLRGTYNKPPRCAILEIADKLK